MDYPENDGNTKRLIHLLQLYEEAIVRFPNQDPIPHILDLKKQKNLRIPEAKEKTQLDAVKNYLGNCAKNYGYAPMRQLWLPVIPGQIYIDDLRRIDSNTREYTEFRMKTAQDIGHNWSIPIIIGQFDDPANQSQPIFHLDIAQAENIGIFGTIACGKSTLMQTMMYSYITNYSPEIIEIYGIDFSNKMMNAFRDAPHVKGLYFENDIDRIDQLISNLNFILQKRKEILSGGSFSQYVQKNGVNMPAVLIFIDNMASLNAKSGERFVDDLIRIAKEGVNYGFYMILSGAAFGSSDIPGSFNDSIKTQLTLSLQDKYAYGDMLHDMRVEILPEAGIKGRGLAKYEGRILEYQVGLALKAENDFMRMDMIERNCREIKEAWVPEVNSFESGKAFSWKEFTAREDFFTENQKAENLTIGLCADSDELYSIPLKETLCYMICGEGPSGKTNAMKVCIEAALAKNAQVCIVDSEENPDYPKYEMRENVTYVKNGTELFDFLEPDFSSEFVRRNRLKNQLLEEGKDNDEIFEVLSQEEPIFIFIKDMDLFIDFVYDAVVQDELGGRKALPRILQSFMLKGRYHNIYFFAEMHNKEYMNDDDILMDAMKEAKSGIHFGGIVERNGMLDFEYMRVSKRLDPQDPGMATLPDYYYNLQDISKVRIPKV